jgi:hypothetical protein
LDERKSSDTSCSSHVVNIADSSFWTGKNPAWLQYDGGGFKTFYLEVETNHCLLLLVDHPMSSAPRNDI